jgi:hypothetical protein
MLQQTLSRLQQLTTERSTTGLGNLVVHEYMTITSTLSNTFFLEYFVFVVCLVRHCCRDSSVIIVFLILTDYQMHNKGAQHMAAESRMRDRIT